MAGSWYVLRCCNALSSVVWIDANSTLGQDLLGTSVGDVYRTVGVAGTCLELAQGPTSSPTISQTHTISASVTGLIQTLSNDCSDAACTNCTALTPIPSPSPDPTDTPTPTPSISSTQTPTVTPTATVTPTVTSTLMSTPTPTNSVTPTSTQTPTPTPSSTPQAPIGGSVSFRLFDQVFNCNTVRKLVGCDNSTTYYVSDYLSYDSTEITTGMTFVADIVSVNGAEKLCLYYESDVDGSSTSYVTQVYSIETNCDVCDVQPTPTPTTSPTPTLTPTPTVTPSPSIAEGFVYVYVKCEESNTMIVQNVPVPGVGASTVFKFGDDCWVMYGTFALPWSPPSIYTPINLNYNYFGVPIEIYDNCATCQTPPPTPSNSPILSPTPTPSTALTCLFYKITNYNQFDLVEFTYTDCDGISQGDSLNRQRDVTICSTTFPIAPNGVVTPLNIPCN